MFKKILLTLAAVLGASVLYGSNAQAETVPGVNYPEVHAVPLVSEATVNTLSLPGFNVAKPDVFVDPEVAAWTHTDIDYTREHQKYAGLQDPSWYTYQKISASVYGVDGDVYHHGFTLSVGDFIAIKAAEASYGAHHYKTWYDAILVLVSEGKVKESDLIKVLPRRDQVTGFDGWEKSIITSPNHAEEVTDDTNGQVDFTDTNLSDYLVWAVKNYYGGAVVNGVWTANNLEIQATLAKLGEEVLANPYLVSVNLSGVFARANAIDPQLTAQLFWFMGLNGASVDTFTTLDLSDNGFTNALITTSWIPLQSGTVNSSVTELVLTGNSNDVLLHGYQNGYTNTEAVFTALFNGLR
ncbi:MAG: hypothetical protein LBT80_03550 [Lactobacillaceae bacterium]|jgi:hypothetical protein|nr:hypothetical protein [Lactobacillaceae bacterium]